MASDKKDLWGSAATVGANLWPNIMGASPTAGPLGADYALTSGTLEGLPFAAPSSAAPSALSTAGPYAAALAAAWGTGAGIDSAMDDWKNGEKQSGAIRGTNALASPAAGFMGQMGGPLGSDKAQSYAGALLGNPIAIADVAGINFFTGKDKDQQVRDKWRSVMQGSGVLDDDYNITNADGGKFDLGKDGKTKNYNIDWSKEDAGSKVGLLDPLGDLTTSGDKARSDAVGQMYNAANSSGDFGENIKKYYADAGYTHETAYQGILDKYKDKTDAESINRRDAELASLDRLYGTDQKAKPASNGGGGGGGGTTTIVVKPEDTTFLPNIGVTPTQSTPAPVLEPDDEPTTEEQSSVDQYASLLKKKLKETKAK